jgi:hypothetical protein
MDRINLLPAIPGKRAERKLHQNIRQKEIDARIRVGVGSANARRNNMNAILENAALRSPVVFSNSRLLLGLVALSGIVGMILAVGIGILAIKAFFPLHGYTTTRVLSVLFWILGTWFTWRLSRTMWNLSFNMAGNRARFDSQSLDFELGPQNDPRDQQKCSMRWDQITAIRHQRIGNMQSYCVVGKDDTCFKFSSYTFFHPKKLARQISARCGRPIEEVK